MTKKMKRLLMPAIALLLVLTVALAASDNKAAGNEGKAQLKAVVTGQGNGPGDGTGNNCRFVDEDGDGINDNFRDHDGDGIPNHDDPDWTRPKDGSGYKNQNGKKDGERGNGFKHGQVDGNGNGNSFQHRNQQGTCTLSNGQLNGGNGNGNGNGNGGKRNGGKG